MSVKSAPRSFAILGSATFTTVTSSSSMNVAVQTAIRVHHLRSMGRDITPARKPPPAGVRVRTSHKVRTVRIEAVVASAPDRPALAAGERVLTFGELDAAATRRAEALGDVAGQRVLVVAP